MDVVVTMLPAGPHVRSVYMEDGKVIESAAKGTLMIDCTTADVETSRAVNAAALEAGRAAGLYSVLSRVTEGNDASFALHDRLGFRHVGTLEKLGEKFGRRHDVRMYQLVL